MRIQSYAALFAGAGLLVAVLVFVDRLGTRPLDRGSTGRTFERMMWESLPLYIDEERLHELRACRFDFSGPVLRPGVFTGPQTEYLGNPRGPEVVVFFDPNCPHCSAYYTEYRRMAARYSDRARFTVVPLLLWRESARQAAALTLAERTGKYFELWQAMFDHSPGHTRSLTVEQIAALFSSLGLDTRELAARLAVAEKEIARLHRPHPRADALRRRPPRLGRQPQRRVSRHVVRSPRPRCGAARRVRRPLTGSGRGGIFYVNTMRGDADLQVSDKSGFAADRGCTGRARGVNVSSIGAPCRIVRERI